MANELRECNEKSQVLNQGKTNCSSFQIATSAKELQSETVKHPECCKEPLTQQNGSADGSALC